MMKYKIPCGRTTGHGESCVKDALCHACSTMMELKESAQQYYWQMGGYEGNHHVVRLNEALDNIEVK